MAKTALCRASRGKNVIAESLERRFHTLKIKPKSINTFNRRKVVTERSLS